MLSRNMARLGDLCTYSAAGCGGDPDPLPRPVEQRLSDSRHAPAKSAVGQRGVRRLTEAIAGQVAWACVLA